MLLFSGLVGNESSPVAQLRTLYQKPQHARFFSTVFEALRTVSDRAGRQLYEQYLPNGRHFEEMIRSNRLLDSNPIVEGVCSHVVHLCLLQPHAERNPEQRTGHPVVSIGLSLGLTSAIIAALQIEDCRTFLEHCYYSIAIVTFGLLRSHQVGDAAAIEPALAARYRACRHWPGDPTPMAVLAGVTRVALADLIATHNSVTDVGPVEIGLVNSDTFCVLSGGKAALMDFWIRNEATLKRPGVRWAYVNTTAPFHSTVLEPAIKLLEEDRDFLGYRLTGAQLAIPVYTTQSPGNLQTSLDPFRDACMQVICRPQDWQSTVATAVLGHKPNRVVDFGPSLAAQAFAKLWLRSAGVSVQYTHAFDRHLA